LNIEDLQKAVHKDERVKDLRIRRDEVNILVKVILEQMFKGLIRDGKLKLQNLFSLDIREIKSRRIRNPQTKELMYTSDYNKVGIEPSGKLKEELKKYKK
jgi:nucleoid DNA-binding protein